MEFRVPGSKSISNRVLHIQSLASGHSEVIGLLESDDTRAMRKVWSALAGAKRDGVELHAEHAGTVARFVLPILPMMPYMTVLTGSARMCERPMGELIRAMREMGCRLEELGLPGCLPLRVHPTGPLRGGDLFLRGDISSQFVSGLMMAAPMFESDLRIFIQGTLVSQDYVQMTAEVMLAFGASAKIAPDFSWIHVPCGLQYRGTCYEVEGDWSSASYWFGLAAIHGTQVTVQGLFPKSLQGDQKFIHVLERMGCSFAWSHAGITCTGPKVLKGIDVDMHHISDTVPTLVAVSLFAQGQTVIRNVANMRLKECDRITALVTESRKLGANVTELSDGMVIEGGAPLRGARISTYEDHRIAMSFGILGTKVPGVSIENPGCVAKTFPNFFDALAKVENLHK